MFKNLFNKNKSKKETNYVKDCRHIHIPHVNSYRISFNRKLYSKIANTLVPYKRQNIYKLTFDKFDNSSMNYVIITDINLPLWASYGDLLKDDSVENCTLRLEKYLLRLMIISFNMIVLSGRCEYAELYKNIKSVLQYANDDISDINNQQVIRRVTCTKVDESELSEEFGEALSLYSSIDRLTHPEAVYDNFYSNREISHAISTNSDYNDTIAVLFGDGNH